MLHAIIMAGGTGTRFWPASRNDTPKQLLQLVGNESMIRQTLDRLGELVPSERRMVVTNTRLVDAMRKQLPDCRQLRSSASHASGTRHRASDLAALLVSRNDPDAVMAVMPADHVIRPADKFQAAIRPSRRAGGRIAGTDRDLRHSADVSRGDLWLHPSRRGNRGWPCRVGSHRSYAVKQFKEKPDAATAAKYLASGEYYWNSGIFVWRASTILDASARVSRRC